MELSEAIAWGLPALLLAIFLIAALIPFVQPRWPRTSNVALIIFSTLLTSYFFLLMPEVLSGNAYEWEREWVPQLGINLSFRIDGLSLLFALLISGIGTLVLIYSAGYMKSRTHTGRFFAQLMFFMGAMLGLVVVDNLLLTFVFWELTSVSSYLLIGFDHEKSSARDAARQALLLTSAGGLALLAGFLILTNFTGATSYSQLMSMGEFVRGHELYGACLVLILIGVFTKSAQVPFHFWLPNAMAAPTPVSAYLHSATMVKAGIYLLARLAPVMGGTDLWQNILIPIGSATALLGPLLALEQTDLKRLLAYSTIGALGMLTLLLGLGSHDAVMAAMTYLLVHSLYKGSLFMVAGAVDHEAGTRNVLGLRGLYKRMPVTSIAAALAALSMAGFPPLFGFLGKELIYEAKLEAANAGWITFAIGFVSNMVMVSIAFMVGLEPFAGKKTVSPKEAREANWTLWLGPLILALMGLGIGLWPQLFAKPILSSAARSVFPGKEAFELGAWHGFNVVFFFSLLTLLGGVLIYVFRAKVRSWTEFTTGVTSKGPNRAYGILLEWLVLGSDYMVGKIQSGQLSRYITVLIATTCAALALVFIYEAEVLSTLRMSPVVWHETILVLVVAVAAVTAAFGFSRTLLIVCMGVIGFGIAVLFALYSAPDVAITQILVETLSVILTVFLISRLPKLQDRGSQWVRIMRMALASMIGVLMALLAWINFEHESHHTPISEFFARTSLIEAKGRNVVNVILVDYRALDTLGEITVLTAAALGVSAMLAMRKRRTNGEAK